MNDDRCPVCDREMCEVKAAEREMHAQQHDTSERELAIRRLGRVSADCSAHAVDWRARAMKAEKREKRRIDSVCWLFMSNYINDVHNDDCPGDDTCECYPAAHMSVAVNDPDMMPTDAELQRLRAALDDGEGTS